MSNATNASETPSPRGRRKINPAPVAPTIWEQWQFVVIAAGVLILCTTLITGIFYVLRQVQAARRDTESSRSQNPVASAQLPNSSAVPVDLKAADAQLPQPTTGNSLANRARLLRIQADITKAHEGLETIRKLRVWKYETILELYDSESGRRIAASKENVQNFMSLIDFAVPSPAAIESMQQRLDSFAYPTVAAISGDTQPQNAPAQELGVEFDRLLKEIQEMEFGLSTMQDSIQKLQYLASKDAPAEETLGSVVQALRLEAAAKRIAELRTVQATAKQEAEALILAAEKDAIAARGKAEAEARRLVGELEASALIEDAKLRQEKLSAEINQKRESQRAAELRARAADPIVQQKYTPFLDKGKLLFDQGSDYVSGYGERMLPVSWQNLNNGKWLDSAERFAKAMSNPFSQTKNDRRVKAYPQTENEWREMDRMFEEFKQLGPIWVEMGLLLP